MNPVTAPLVGLVCDDIGRRQGFGLAGVALVIAAGLAWHALRDTAGGSAAVRDRRSPTVVKTIRRLRLLESPTPVSTDRHRR